MPYRLSTGMRNALMGKPATLAVTDGTIDFTATDTIADTSSRFLDSGFRPGDLISITATVNNNYTFLISTLTAGSMTVTAINGQAVTSETPTNCTITGYGKGFTNLFRYHSIHIYSGNIPADADSAISATPLIKLQDNSVPNNVTPGTSTYGLEFGTAALGVLPVGSTAPTGKVTVAGTAGWFCLFDNAVDVSDSTSDYVGIRCMGTVGTSGAELNITSVSLALDAIITLNTHNLTLPAV